LRISKIYKSYIFDWKIISKAIKLITRLECGYKDDLIVELDKLTNNKGQELFLILCLLGFVKTGIAKNGRETWSATDRAYKELSFFDYLLYKIRKFFKF